VCPYNRQEQWPEWLGTAEFAYNNKVHLSTWTSPFKANYRQDPRIGFEGRKKGKYQGAEKFIEKMKEIQEEAKAALRKVQEEMKKYADGKRVEVNDYKVGDLVMLSTKDLKYKMVRRRTEKLTKSVRATGHKTPGESSDNITVSSYDTTHLQKNPQRLG